MDGLLRAHDEHVSIVDRRCDSFGSAVRSVFFRVVSTDTCPPLDARLKRWVSDISWATDQTGQVLPRIVPILRCPLCHVDGQLELAGPIAADGTVANGTLRCARCQRSTPISNGIWDAIGTAQAPRTLAQLSNVVAPTPQLYERIWRVRSLSLLSGRAFPNSEELAELNHWFEPLPPRSIVIDIGCSEGLYARSVAASGHIVIAIDHSRPFLERVIKHRKNLPIVAIRTVAQHLPIADASCDGVMIGGTLNEIGDQTTAATEMGRVCRPGGLFFDMSLTRASSRGGKALQALLRPTGVRFPTRDATKQLFINAGFEVDRMRADRVVLRLEGHRSGPC